MQFSRPLLHTSTSASLSLVSVPGAALEIWCSHEKASLSHSVAPGTRGKGRCSSSWASCWPGGAAGRGSGGPRASEQALSGPGEVGLGAEAAKAEGLLARSLSCARVLGQSPFSTWTDMVRQCLVQGCEGGTCGLGQGPPTPSLSIQPVRAPGGILAVFSFPTLLYPAFGASRQGLLSGKTVGA